MCETCDSVIVDTLKMDFYSAMTKKRDEILADEEMADVFGEAFEELIQNYAHFVERIFQGHYESDSIARRQEQWEARLIALVTQVEHGLETEEGEVLEEQRPENEEPQKLHMPKISLTKKNPFSPWANLDKGDSPFEG